MKNGLYWLEQAAANAHGYVYAPAPITESDFKLFNRLTDEGFLIRLDDEWCCGAKHRITRAGRKKIKEYNCGCFSHFIPDGSDRCKCGAYSSSELYSITY